MVIYCNFNRIADVMVSVLVFSGVDREFELWSGQTKTMKLIFVDSLLRTQH